MVTMERFEGDVACPTWREAISAMVDGELAPTEQQALWAHLRHCAACRAYYRQLAALRQRLHRTDVVRLWLQSVKTNRQLRRGLVVAVIVTALLSAGLTASFARRWWQSPVMTPPVAVGLFERHLQAPPEWQANPHCFAGMECLHQQTNTTVPQFLALPHWGRLERMGICECLKTPIALYRLTVNGQPVLLFQFSADRLPLQTPEGERFTFNGRTVTCTVIGDVHLLMWQERGQGFVLATPSGKVNPFQVLQRIALP
jgi:hypothetical protein